MFSCPKVQTEDMIIAFKNFTHCHSSVGGKVGGGPANVHISTLINGCEVTAVKKSAKKEKMIKDLKKGKIRN